MTDETRKIIIVSSNEGEYSEFSLYNWENKGFLSGFENVKFNGMSSKSLTDDKDVCEYVDEIISKLGFLRSTRVQVLLIYEKENERFYEWLYKNMKENFQIATEDFTINQGKLNGVLKSKDKVQLKDNRIVCNSKQYLYSVFGGKSLIIGKRQEEEKQIVKSVPKESLKKHTEERKIKNVVLPVLEKVKDKKKNNLESLPPLPKMEVKNGACQSFTSDEAKEFMDRIIYDSDDE